ncbi:MAG TPA: biotin/lipoyl-binding protein [Oscillospiraceae bacterium]|nr:biotin/lipoyl-binding protein [Oscillospiraceae bacterium]HPF56691.1 biotin/lipoyl-binding protein [Clostridiales bacterium]HPK35334.1 biotin/lipoyl-binding protein [Oscillospiraceae bacterium]HPR74650.1 biotin/lipoyl-binding protein [Oscillospiraceae bacterium]
MKNLKITVNGKTYDVAVEEVGSTAAAAPTPAPTPAAAPAPAPAAAPAAAADGNPVKAPMPGTIINVFAKQGDTVEKGQVLLILEAMKMENEIQAAEAGTVTGVNVKKGDTVNADDVLLTIA